MVSEITSTVDWCEENYVHSHYIAEFYNTLSSFALVLAGYIGMKLHYNHKLFTSLFIVGLGSVAFHCTLSRWGQMMDEIPMVILLLHLSRIYLPISRKLLACFGAVYVLFIAYSTLNSEISMYQFLFFQSTFVGIAASSVLFAKKTFEECDNAVARQIAIIGFVTFMIGWSMWLLERALCNVLISYNVHLQLHAMWHLFSAIGTYHICVYTLNIDTESCIKRFYGIPYVEKIKMY